MNWCSIVALIEDGQNIWYLQNNKNGLYHFHKENGQLNWIPFLEESFCTPSLYMSLQQIGSKIVCVPHGANKTAVYDRVTERVNYIPLLENSVKSNEYFMPYANFSNSFVHGSCIYMLGYYYPAILKYDVDTGRVEYLNDWLREIDAKIPFYDKRGFFGRGGIVYLNPDTVLLPLSCTNGLLKLNLQTDQTEVIWLESLHNGIFGISADEKQRIWMVGHGAHEEDVVVWEYDSRKYRVIHIPDVRKEELFCPFYQPVMSEQKIYFIPLRENHIYSVIKNGDAAEVDVPLEQLLNIGDDRESHLLKYYLLGYHDGILSIVRSHDMSWHKINLDTMEDQIKRFDDREFEDIYMETMSRHEKFETITYETTMPLEFFCRYLQMKKSDNNWRS